MHRGLWTTTLLCALAVLGGCVGGTRDAQRPSPSPASTPVAASPSPAMPEASLRLTRRLPAEYVDACAVLRRRVHANPCPPLVPDGRIKVSGPFERENALDLGSSSLDAINGHHVETNGGHWTIWVATSRPDRERLADALHAVGYGGDEPSRCRFLELERERVEACQVPPYEKGGGYYGGHIAYAWQRGGVVYHVTIHGYANEPRLRLMMAALIGQERDAATPSATATTRGTG
jgi:hypothetical protein